MFNLQSMFNPFLTTLLLSVLLPAALYSQPGALARYIELGLSQNLELQRQQLALGRRQLEAKRARAAYLPQVDLAASYLLADGGRTIDVPVGDLLNPVYGALNQTVEGSPFPTDLENASEQLLPNNFHDTRLRVRQPLFNTGIHYGARIAEQQIEVQDAQLRVLEADVARDISVAYYQHLQTHALIAIYDSTRVLLEELLRFNRKLVRHDKATRDAVTTVNFELAQLAGDRAEAVRRREQSRAYFNQLLHRPLDAPIERDTADRQKPAPGLTALADLQLQAVRGRAELQQLQEAIAANELLVELREKDRLPELGLELNAGFQGFGYHFDREQSYVTLGFSLEWNLFGGKQKQLRIQEAQLARRQTQQQYAQAEERVQLQVINAYYDLAAAYEKYRAREAARVSAAESFRIIRQKYERQKVLLVELLDARTRYTTTRIETAIAAYDIKIKAAELDRAIKQ